MKITKNIDLRWSLWSDDLGIWERESDALELINSYLGMLELASDEVDDPDATLTIQTAPWKEIRFGEVKFKGDRITVSFRSEWDEIHELIEDDDPDEVIWEIYNELANPSIVEVLSVKEITKDIKSQDAKDYLKAVLTAIDDVENQLLKLDKQNWKEFSSIVQI